MEASQIKKKKYMRERGAGLAEGGFWSLKTAECFHSAVIRQVREVLLAGESERDTEVLIQMIRL